MKCYLFKTISVYYTDNYAVTMLTKKITQMFACSEKYLHTFPLSFAWLGYGIFHDSVCIPGSVVSNRMTHHSLMKWRGFRPKWVWHSRNRTIVPRIRCMTLWKWLVRSRTKGHGVCLFACFVYDSCSLSFGSDSKRLHNEECRLLGYKYPVHTSQETHYVSTTESSQLMLCKILGSHSGDYEEWRLLGCYAECLL
jgi:hypothetical protein